LFYVLQTRLLCSVSLAFPVTSGIPRDARFTFLMLQPESWLNERVEVVTWAVCINRTYCGEGGIDRGSINDGYIGRI